LPQTCSVFFFLSSSAPLLFFVSFLPEDNVSFSPTSNLRSSCPALRLPFSSVECPLQPADGRVVGAAQRVRSRPEDRCYCYHWIYKGLRRGGRHQRDGAKGIPRGVHSTFTRLHAHLFSSSTLALDTRSVSFFSPFTTSGSMLVLSRDGGGLWKGALCVEVVPQTPLVQPSTTNRRDACCLAL
jgi:hypothetical protein